MNDYDMKDNHRIECIYRLREMVWSIRSRVKRPKLCSFKQGKEERVKIECQSRHRTLEERRKGGKEERRKILLEKELRGRKGGSEQASKQASKNSGGWYKIHPSTQDVGSN